MNHYLLQDLNDPSKYKVEARSSSVGTICKVDPGTDPDIVDVIDELDEQGNPTGKKTTQINATKQTNKQAAEATASTDRAWKNLRDKRDQMLKNSDYSQLEDSPYDAAKKAEYVTYRQELRDLPANTPDPSNPSWPVEPS